MRRRIGGRGAWLGLLLPLAWLLGGCGEQYGDDAERRALYARDAQGGIFIAVIRDAMDPGFERGVELAVREVNSVGGRLLGRPLRVSYFPPEPDPEKGAEVARRITRDPRISAIIGHRNSSIALPVSAIYERGEVLFLPSFATSPRLTRHGFNFIQRILPDNSVLAAQTASVVSLLGHRRIAILHGRDDYSRSSAFLFEDQARELGLEVVYRTSFFQNDDNYRGLLGQLKGQSFDAFYLSAGQDAGARMVRQMREMGLVTPVFGSDHLAGVNYRELVGEAGDNTVAPAVYELRDSGPNNREFVAAYRAAYDGEPGQAAAQGYDAVQLFAAVVRDAGSTEPQVLATNARYGPPRAGVSGIYAYDGNGNVHGKVFRFRVLRFGRWQPLTGVVAPYRLDSFRLARQRIASERKRHGEEGPNPTDGAAAKLSPLDKAVASLDMSILEQPGLSRVERNRMWLALAHEVLKFENLGVVSAPGAVNRAVVNLVKDVAALRGFNVDVCELEETSSIDAAPSDPLATVSEAATALTWVSETDNGLSRNALYCWSRLAREVDALLLAPKLGLSADLLRRLNRTLRDFRVLSFTLDQTLEENLGLTVTLETNAVDLNEPEVALRFEGVMHEMAVQALNRRLFNLPVVRVNLRALAQTGVRPDPRLMTIISGVIDTEAPTAGPATAEPESGMEKNHE